MNTAFGNKLNNRRLALKQIGVGSVGLLSAPALLFVCLVLYSLKETIINGRDIIQDLSNLSNIFMPWMITLILGVWVFPQYNVALSLVKYTTEEIINLDIQLNTRRSVSKWQNCQWIYLFCEIAAWVVSVGLYCHFNGNWNAGDNIRSAITWACCIMLLNLCIFIRVIFVFAGRKFIRELDYIGYDDSETYRQTMLYNPNQEIL